jgi:hypothetical protein
MSDREDRLRSLLDKVRAKRPDERATRAADALERIRTASGTTAAAAVQSSPPLPVQSSAGSQCFPDGVAVLAAARTSDLTSARQPDALFLAATSSRAPTFDRAARPINSPVVAIRGAFRGADCGLVIAAS